MKLMNIDTSTLDGKIKVMQLAKEGRKVASRNHGGSRWEQRNADKIKWAWDLTDYAVIEEPVEVWVVLAEVDGRPISITLTDSKGKAEAWASAWNILNNRERYRAVKLHEVQE